MRHILMAVFGLALLACACASGRGTVPSTSPMPAETIVYRTDTGTKYHVSTCSYLSKSKIAISLKDAKARGLTPCSKCNPPR